MDERVTVTNATRHTRSHYTQRGRPHPKRDAAADDHAWDADDARSDWPGFLALAGLFRSSSVAVLRCRLTVAVLVTLGS